MTEESVKRKLTAILCAGVKGYSRMMGEDAVYSMSEREEDARTEVIEVLRLISR
jgi:hypothetical protein